MRREIEWGSMTASTLVDSEIIERVGRGQLIVEGFEEAGVRQACYELRASTTFYDLASPDRPEVAPPGSSILLKPQQMLVFITEERLELDASTLGRVLSKGQLFSLGLVPVNTYADPGFTGRLGIVMINASNNYLQIPVGTPIAKIEFVDLGKNVAKPYRGQHGYETKIWPIQHSFILTEAEIRSDPRIGTVPDEVEQSYGSNVGMVVRRVFAYERRLIVWSVIFFAILLGVLALNFAREDRVDLWVSVGVGLVTNVIFLWLTLAATNTRRKKSTQR